MPTNATASYPTKLTLLRDFVLGQGTTQLIQALTGFAIVRYLPADHFSILTLAFAFQTTASIYTEMGVGSSIIPLVGQDTENQNRLTRLTTAAFQLRYFYFGIVGTACLLLFPVATLGKGWNSWLIVNLMGSILLTLWASGNVNIYSTSLRIHRDLKGIYRAQVIPGLSRLLLVVGLLFTGFANAGNLAWIAALAVVANGWMVKKRSNFSRSGAWAELKSERREILRITTPLIPGTIFYALQGQILIFLTAAFSSTKALAELGALGRLTILFTMVGAFAGQVIGPWFARQPSCQLIQRFIAVLAIYVSFVAFAVLVAIWLPAPFIWILGPQYSHVSEVLPLAFCTSSLAMLNGTLWTLNHARGWIYWWGEILNIPAVILTQVVGFLFLGASSLSSLFIVSIAGQVATMLVYLSISRKGFSPFGKT